MAFAFDMNKANGRTQYMSFKMKADPQAVSIHVRRGDYVSEKHWKSLGCICQRSYYLMALSEIERKVNQPHYYVFSEDLDWVREHLPLTSATFVDWNKGEDSWQDMMLMSCCHHHIICNSTFSWWGAWLNPLSDKIVVAPKRWAEGRSSSDIDPKTLVTV